MVNCMNKMSKKNILALIAVIYLAVLVFFGFSYWFLANKSGGSFFIFHQGINSNVKLKAFEDDIKLRNVTDELENSILELICSDENRRTYKSFDNANLKSEVFVSSDGVIGYRWAKYYYYLLKSKGITHVSIDNVESNNIIKNLKTYKVTLSFYKCMDKNSRGLPYGKKEDNQFQFAYQDYIWIENGDYAYIPMSDKFHYYPLNYYFVNLIENSLCYLDNSPFVLKKVANGNLNYSIWDFIYFSSVTITTLGYGDILPNSTIVRILVMIETVTGVVITGAFVSCLFWNKQ